VADAEIQDFVAEVAAIERRLVDVQGSAGFLDSKKTEAELRKVAASAAAQKGQDNE
jgi:hypothetical protein